MRMETWCPNNKMKSIMKKSNYQQYVSHELEKLLFGVETYLEDNSFATGHQLVNVYKEPQKRYEIRSEENAIDVQVHGASDYLPFWTEDKQNSGPTIDEIKDMLIGQNLTASGFKPRTDIFPSATIPSNISV